MDTASSRATSTSLKLELDNGALFALTTLKGKTPTPSADNLGFPEEPESSTASQLVVVFVATSLVLCPIPSQSAWAMSTLPSTHHFVAQGASLIVQVSRLALDSFLHSPWALLL